jgi:hypothetical protein
MILNSKEQGNAIFHVATNPDGGLQPIINVSLLWSNQELLLQLMQTDHIGIDTLEMSDGRCFMILFDKSCKQPYPSVMIWRFVWQGEDRIIIDVEQQDLGIVFLFLQKHFKK